MRHWQDLTGLLHSVHAQRAESGWYSALSLSHTLTRSSLGMGKVLPVSNHAVAEPTQGDPGQIYSVNRVYSNKLCLIVKACWECELTVELFCLSSSVIEEGWNAPELRLWDPSDVYFTQLSETWVDLVRSDKQALVEFCFWMLMGGNSVEKKEKKIGIFPLRSHGMLSSCCML